MTPWYYHFRGYILGLLAVILLLTPGTGAPILRSESIIAAVLLLAGATLRIEARRSIGEHTRKKLHEASELVTTGIYAHLRHPLYLSNSIIALSAVIFHLGFNPSALPFIIVVALFETALARAEDRFLQGKFGELWEVWAKRTHAFWPAFITNTEQNALKRTFFTAFCADWSTWAWLTFFNLILLLKKFF